MKCLPVRGLLPMAGLVLVPALLLPSTGQAQVSGERVKAAYFRAVAEHFKVPIQEVATVGDWDLSPDEVPVVFFVADRAGVSPDAIIGLRRNGGTWMEVCSRFGLGVGAFHLTLPPEAPLGLLTSVYEQFGREDWNRIRLADQEIITLVNLRVLAEQAGVPPLRVLRSREEAGSFVAAFSTLRNF